MAFENRAILTTLEGRLLEAGLRLPSIDGGDTLAAATIAFLDLLPEITEDPWLEGAHPKVAEGHGHPVWGDHPASPRA